MTVIFCLPGTSFSHEFLCSWSELLISLQKNNITPLLSMAQDSNIYYVRNKCLGGDVLRGPKQKPFDGKVPYDYLMWVDSDVIFTPEHFYSLIRHQKDIVSGLYMMDGGKQFATVKNWDEEFFSQRGYFEFMTPEDIKNSDSLIEVDYTGFGFMLIKCEVFESLDYPWFRPLFHKIGSAEDFSSEDVSFCKLIKDKGFKIFVDPSIRVGHKKSVIL